MRYGDVTTVKAALKTLLTGPEFEQACQGVERRYTHGLTLERLPAAQVKTTELVGEPPAYPFVEIVAGDSRALALAQQGEDYQPFRHAIGVVFWVDGDDEETVTALAEMYALAWRQVLIGGLLSPLVPSKPVHVGREDSGVLGRKTSSAGRPFVKARVVECEIETHDAE